MAMVSISDLSYIMSTFAPVLKIAYEKMSRNDYLFTAAILAQIEPNVNSHVGDKHEDMEHLYFPGELFMFRLVKISGSMREDCWDIVIGDGEQEVVIGSCIWCPEYENPRMYSTRLKVNDNAERDVCCTALGMTESEFESYFDRKEAWKASRKHGEMDNRTYPNIEVVMVGLEQGCSYRQWPYAILD
ncbi:hypothetical protein P280DRAFT_536358 [Massarina eburnea CBS 473.64]|uniref:Uncharacterized protein n=1 Tax=Massarina eburnea CBS 473.64 TaxID=1395130 RepID=A0A6A6RK23_9PLEO|nr:hypothetical protein P280DRAFT_536358 [Massarina eburnea CBS 473.64]